MAQDDRGAHSLAARAIDLLGTLIGFDTTSRRSNLDLIEWVEHYLGRLGIASRRVLGPGGTKSNLFATIGPNEAGGVVLSGHTDVVPIDGQSWTSPAFELTERQGRLYGRGTCDMKGFLALALAAAPDLVAARLVRPVHLAFSYDEEVGCLGARDLIAAIREAVPKPAAVIVGEPTNMEVVSGHKGAAVYRIVIHGHEAHSSLTHLGVSANMEAIGVLNRLSAVAEALSAGAADESLFQPAESTLTVGWIRGGAASNILARECEILFDLRTVPGDEPEVVLKDVFSDIAKLDAALKARFPGAGARIDLCASTPALGPELNGAAEHLARRLAGDNGPARAVAYAAEAGQFQESGLSTVICGPGSIEQAHQPDEYIEREQMVRGARFMERLVEELSP